MARGGREGGVRRGGSGRSEALGGNGWRQLVMGEEGRREEDKRGEKLGREGRGRGERDDDLG